MRILSEDDPYVPEFRESKNLTLKVLSNEMDDFRDRSYTVVTLNAFREAIRTEKYLWFQWCLISFMVGGGLQQLMDDLARQRDVFESNQYMHYAIPLAYLLIMGPLLLWQRRKVNAVVKLEEES
jgi:hypothetical protein